MRIRIKFAKKESVKYLGHLDIMRFFQRCFNRADVKMEYSEGFNPHQKMSFAQPLGVGITSCGEYLDAEIAGGQDLEAICKRLNDVCGDGFEILSVKEVEEGAKKAMAALRYASYEVGTEKLFPCAAAANEESEAPKSGDASSQESETILQSAIDEVLKADSILVLKRTKSGEREVDIRPQIVKAEAKGATIFMTVTAASDNNLKAETLAGEIFSKTNIEYDREKITIKRTELYADDFVPLYDFQTL